MIPPRYLRVAQALSVTAGVALTASCSSVAGPGDGAASDVAASDGAGTDGDSGPPLCPTPRPADFSPCPTPDFVCIVPPDPSPPDAMVTPSGGQCRCDTSGGTPQIRCFLAGGPLPPPELAA
jgi:hypothetical protein